MQLLPRFYTSKYVIILLPLIVYLGHIVYKKIFGDDSFQIYFIDKIFHIFGGIVVSISFSGILWNLSRMNIIILKDKIVYTLLVYGLLSFVIIIWEIYEYIFLYPNIHMTYDDLVLDMVCGLVGGIISLVFLIKIKYH